MIIRTEAVVLRNIDYGETSSIVTLYTREKGKLTVMAKAARRPKSKYGSTLQPLSCTQVILYYKPNRGLHTLSESAHVQLLNDLGRDLQKIAIGLRIVELVGGLMHEEEPNAHIFNLLMEALSTVNHTRTGAWNVLPYFQLRLASELGFEPLIDKADVNALPDAGGYLVLDTGAVQRGSDGSPAARRGSRASLRAFAVLARASLDTVLRMRLNDGARSEVNTLVNDFLRYHTDDAYPSKTERVFRQILGGSSSEPGT